MQQSIPSDVYQRLLAIPVHPSAPKRWAIYNALKFYALTPYEIEELKAQWEFATPQVAFPIPETV